LIKTKNERMAGWERGAEGASEREGRKKGKARLIKYKNIKMTLWAIQ
jgi:hypothetical protein